MYTYRADSSTATAVAAAATSSDMETSGYLDGYSFNNNPTFPGIFHNDDHMPFLSTVVNRRPAASVSGSRSDHHRGVYQMDQQLTCLNLGKRHNLELERSAAASVAVLAGKKWKPYYGDSNTGPSSATAVAVPKCQVDGCHAPLVRAKEYHRRHKVCEVHSKAATVVVLGVDQRFCQQCSRFHAVSQFDESKRSCRRKLAGHNERRRKICSNSITAISHAVRASSLLSSTTNANLSSRSSAALRELIDEHRATTILAGNHPINNDWAPRFDERKGERHVMTLDFMQAPPRLQKHHQ